MFQATTATVTGVGTNISTLCNSKYVHGHLLEVADAIPKPPCSFVRQEDLTAFCSACNPGPSPAQEQDSSTTQNIEDILKRLLDEYTIYSALLISLPEKEAAGMPLLSLFLTGFATLLNTLGKPVHFMIDVEFTVMASGTLSGKESRH